MAVTNARPVFTYSDASGFRAGYASYNGQWYLNWPIGQEAVVQFAPHDSHAAATDVYPRTFPQRVDRCAQMLAGVVSAPSSGFQVAFCGRKTAGTYVLEHVVKGFPGAHGARHLYNMLGGRVYEVDFLFARKQKFGAEVDKLRRDCLQLDLPCRDDPDRSVEMFVVVKEQGALAHALDCLPWNHLSWSIHRGLRDILITYAKPTMDIFRPRLASLMKQTVTDRPELLVSRGWNSQFVRNSMGDMAASAVLAGDGNSGDLVRVVTDVIRALVEEWSLERLDETEFWRKAVKERELDLVAAVALTKVFVLEWSNEFDYQMYHELPTSMLFA